MNCLEEKILSDGIVLDGGVLKVGTFLNHRLDVHLLKQMGKDFYDLFSDKKITQILTVEASGIAIACFAADCFDVPVVFAKKGENRNVGPDVYSSEVFSFTKQKTSVVSVAKNLLGPDDRILIIDDFLAYGEAVFGLADIIRQAGASVEGVGIAVTKAFQPGEKKLIEAGFDVRSLAAIESMENGKIVFRA